MQAKKLADQDAPSGILIYDSHLQLRTRYHIPFRPWALASPVRLMLPLGVQVLQFGDDP
jgi:hypothetical protein